MELGPAIKLGFVALDGNCAATNFELFPKSFPDSCNIALPESAAVSPLALPRSVPHACVYSPGKRKATRLVEIPRRNLRLLRLSHPTTRTDEDLACPLPIRQNPA